MIFGTDPQLLQKSKEVGRLEAFLEVQRFLNNERIEDASLSKLNLMKDLMEFIKERMDAQ